MSNKLFEYRILEADSGTAKAGTIQITKILGVNEHGVLVIPGVIDGISVTSIRVSSSGIYYQADGKWGAIEIKELVIPASVVDIQRINSIFKLLPPIKERLVISDDNPCFSSDGVCLFSKDGTILLDQAVRNVEKYIVPEGVCRIGDYAFKNTQTKQIHLPDSVNTLDGGSFEDNNSIIELTGGKGLRNVSSNAFTDSPFADKPYFAIGNTLIRCVLSGTEYTLPDGIECIADGAFHSSSPENDLMKIRLPSSLRVIGNSVFYGFERLQEIELPEGLLEIGGGAFSCTGIRCINVPTSVTTIKRGAFSNCSMLEEIVFHNQFNAGEDVSKIADNLFSGCSSLKAIELPEGIISIGCSAFRDCKSLEKIVFPESLRTIEDEAFSGCIALREVWISHNVEDISSSAFEHMTCSIRVLEGNKPAGVLFENGVMFTKEKKKKDMYPKESTMKSYIIPDGVEEIAPTAFSGASQLVSVSIPNSVKKIGESAFENCLALTGVSLPNLLEELPNRAFAECRSLDSISIPQGVKRIGKGCFANTALQNVYIPDSVEMVDDYAFEGVALERVTLPASVKKIGYSIFSSTKEITIFDSLAQNAKPAGAYFDDANGYFGDSYIGSIGILQKHNYVIGACNCQWNDHMIIVRNMETGAIKYKVWMGGANQPRNVYCALASGWGRCAEFAFELLDNQVFGKMKSIPDKQKTAVLRLLWPEKLTDAARKRYVSYVKKNATEILLTCIEEDRIDVLQALEPLGIIQLSNIEALVDSSIKHDKTQITAWLIQYRESHFAKDKRETDSLIIEDEISVGWKFAKKKEALLGRYTGNGTYLVFPTELEGQKVLGIAGVNERMIPENYKEIEAIEIPDGYEYIGQNAFAGCINLKRVVLPDSIREIGKGAFANCILLETIRLPASLKNISSQTFKNCNSLKKVEIQQGFSGFIGKEAFTGCSSLERINVQMCIAIEQWAFADSGLKVFIALGDAYCLNNNPFRGCSGYTIYANPGTTIYDYIKSKSKPIAEAPDE